MIQFQFLDAVQTNESNQALLLKKFKAKLRQSTIKPVHAFIGSGIGNINQWEIIYDSKSHQVKALNCLQILKGHKDVINSILYNGRRNELVSCCSDQTIRIWDLNDNNGKQKWCIKMQYKPLCAAWFYCKQTNKKFLIIGSSDSKIQMLDWKSKKVSDTIETNQNVVCGLLVDNDKQEFLTSSGDGLIKLWCAKTFTCLQTFDSKSVGVGILCFLNQEKTMFASCDHVDGVIKVWDYEETQYLCEKKKAHKSGACELIYSNGLQLLISCGWDNQIKAWELKFSKKQKASLKLKFTVETFFDKILGNTKMQFLDPKHQTQLLVGDLGGNLSIVDLLLRKVVWEKKNDLIVNTTSILVQ